MSNVEQGGAGTSGGGEHQEAVDYAYIKSREGVLRIVGIVVAAVGLVFIIASLFASTGGWYFFVGFSFIVYGIIVIVIETCVPNIYMHKLIDAIVMFAYAGLWFLSALLNTVFGIKYGLVLLGIASIFGYVCGALAIAQGIFSLMAWKGGDQGTHPFFIFF